MLQLELWNDRIPQPGGSFIECGKWQMTFRTGQFEGKTI